MRKDPNKENYKTTEQNESDVAMSLDQSLAYAENASMVDELGLEDTVYRKK